MLWYNHKSSILGFFRWCYTCQLIANAKGSLHEYICIYSIIYTPHHRADTTLSVSTLCTRCLSQVSIYSSYLHEFSKHCINIIVTVRPNHFILSDSTLFPHPSLYFFYVSLRQWNIHDSLFHRPYCIHSLLCRLALVQTKWALAYKCLWREGCEKRELSPFTF